MSGNRRNFFTRLSSISAGIFTGRSLLSAQATSQSGSVPVTTPDVADLPFKMDGGIKVFNLIAEPVKQVILPGRTFDLWGFNGSAPGPTIHANEGDRVRIVFENRLPESTGIHWHGLELPVEMDGVPGVGQKPVMPGERFVYEFDLHQHGTFFYHPHMAMQEMVGMLGGFIIYPKTPYAPHVDKDYLIALQEYAVLPNSTIPNSMSMEFNWLTFNGKSGPASTPLIIRQGERVRVRVINMGMDHHPIHLHGFTFWETGREGARQQESAWTRGNTTLVGVAQARDFEFVADRLGDWMLHCHLPHHMMNQMASNVGPMTRLGSGMQAGASMTDGMGMLRDGNATSENRGPSLGRGLGIGSSTDAPRANGPLSQSEANKAMANMPGMDHSQMKMPEVPKNANQVPLFPQDAFMEGPMMAMDKEVDKPETHGLPPGWSGFVGGMMTLVRVMTPADYGTIMDLKAKKRASLTLPIAVLAALLCSFISGAQAQPAGKKAYTFNGKVERIDATAKPLTIANDPIEGWMGSMSMAYAVGNMEVVNRVKVGDRITAQVYDGDFTLYDVKVVAQPNADAQSTASQAGMRLEDFEQMALANNPAIAQVQANLQVAAGLAKQAGLYPNPTAGYYGDEIRGGYARGGKQGGFLSQTIVTGGKLRAARRVAELQSNEVETSGQVQRLRILNNVRALFYRVLTAQRMVEVRGNLAKLAADATQTSHQLGNIGQADRPDILQAEVEQQQANVNLRIAQQNLLADWRMLAAVVGKPGFAAARLEGDLDALPNLNYEESLTTTLRESPEVKLAGQAAERAEASLSQARKAAIPDLQLTGILVQNNTPLFEANPSRATGVQAAAQVGIQLPLFNRNQGNVAAARGAIESAKQELARLKLQIARDLAGLFREYDSARLSVEQYKTEMLPRAEQAYKLYQNNYQKMAAAYPQVLISQRTLFQLEADYIHALENAWQSSLAIRGFGLMDGLSAPAGTPMGIGR